MNEPNRGVATATEHALEPIRPTTGGAFAAAAAATDQSSDRPANLEQMIAAPITKQSDTNKRKKTKTPKQQTSEQAIVPPELDQRAIQRHLDDWLNNCLRDAAPLTNTSSSSEYLDNLVIGGSSQAADFRSHPPNGHKPKHQSHSARRNSDAAAGGVQPMNTSATSATSSTSLPQQQPHQQHPYGFGGSSAAAGAKPSETPTRTMHDPFGANYQKYFPMYPQMLPAQAAGMPHHPVAAMFGSNQALNASSASMAGIGIGGGVVPPMMMMPNPMNAMTAGGYMMNGSRQSNLNSDFSSLPPAVNLLNAGKDLRLDAHADLLDGLEHRHFSDPCLANASDVSKDSGNGPTTNTTQSPKNGDSVKILSTILEQIGALHDTNTKICRSLHENKVDIEALKHAPNWGLRHRRDSISGLSTHSQPLGYAGAFGTHSPAPTFHSGIYTPGMLTDVVREVKDAARVREDALLSRVKALVEERSWMMSDSTAKLQREIEELKSQVVQLKAERKESNAHISKLDDEVKSLRTLITHVLHTSAIQNNHAVTPMPQFYAEHSPVSPPHQQQLGASGSARPASAQQRHLRGSQPMLNLSYGTINSQPDELSSFGGGGGDGAEHLPPDALPNGDGKFRDERRSSRPADESGALLDDRFARICEDNASLRSDLSSALENRKMAESKITSLEHMVMKLQSSITNGDVQLQAANIGNNNNAQFVTSSRNSSFSDAGGSTATVVQQKSSHSNGPAKLSQSNNLNGNVGLIGPVTNL